MIIAPQPHTLTVAGTQLSTFGMYQSGNKTFASAEKDLEFVEIPGKSGDLVIDRNRFRNITREYDCFIVDTSEADFRTKIRNLADFLGSLRTYARIEDTYHPDEFVMGIPEAVDPEVLENLRGANFTLAFNCKPQRFIKTTPTTLQATGSANLVNPSREPAKPLVEMTGAGVLTFGNQSITTTGTGKHIIDCELMTMAGPNGENQNGQVVFNVDQIELPAGTTHVTSTVAATIDPRWWKV